MNRPTVESRAAAEAAEWWVRRDMRPLGEEECIQFEQWLAHPENARAYAKLDATWDALAHAEADPAIQALHQAAHELPAPGRLKSSRTSLMAALAAACAGVLIAVSWMRLTSEAPVRPATQAVAYQSAVGEHRTVELSDGSRVTLDTASAVEALFTSAERRLRLEQGRILVEVAKDGARPFVAEAGNYRARALGTRFEINLDADRVEILLTEGSLMVEGTGSARHGAILLEPGERFVAGTDRTPRVEQGVNIARELLWKDGLVEFDNLRLDEAVTRLNRYSGTPILIRDRAVASLRISGVFRANQRDRFLEVATSVLPIEVRATADTGVIELVAVGATE
jgi:transmembrane sensor